MKFYHYKKLTKICNNILKQQNSFVKYFNFVNIINDHPFRLEKFKKILLNKNFFFNQLPLLKYIKLISIMIYKKILPDFHFSNLSGNKRILIFSHLIDEKFILNGKDFHFGDIFKDLKDDVCFVFFNHLKNNKKKISKNAFKNFPYNSIVLNTNFEIKLFLFFFIKICKLYNSLKLKNTQHKENIIKVNNEIKNIFFRNEMFSLVLYEYQIKKIS